ncbi:hypothetical protein [Nocardia crassostreae]|uniref:hypothetical protein n=1 Tax=Nocardia crassostreae TaxID=53428 RepID=UPI000832576A|nr:hypothetical protein [Nocardia crassostreae]
MATDTVAAKPATEEPSTATRTVAVRMSTLVYSLVVALLLAALGTFGVLWGMARGELSDRDATSADQAHAERAATDYAVGASTIDYQNIDAWTGKLKFNTTSELAAKFDATAPNLRDILTPLRWTSAATPITAKVLSDNGGVYTVDVFLTVTATSAQNPDGAVTTVTYKVTVNKNADWKITDVGSLDAGMPIK